MLYVVSEDTEATVLSQQRYMLLRLTLQGGHTSLKVLEKFLSNFPGPGKSWKWI